jgi:sugar O-acyltransferase (sialic acid O-acetyltransferase NeuD family)
MKNEKIAIYGASGFGREVAWLVESCQDGRVVACFIDDDEKKQGTVLNDIPILSLEQAAEQHQDAKVVGGIGNPRIREFLMNKAAARGFSFDTLVHPRVEMSKWVEMGLGAVICAGNILTTNILLGAHVQINLDCTIGHDVVLNDHTTLAPGVHLSGYVHCGRRVYIGTGAVIINGTQKDPLILGDDVVVGAGSCVTKSISYGTWGGVPARPLHKSG